MIITDDNRFFIRFMQSDPDTTYDEWVREQGGRFEGIYDINFVDDADATLFLLKWAR